MQKDILGGKNWLKSFPDIVISKQRKKEKKIPSAYIYLYTEVQNNSRLVSGQKEIRRNGYFCSENTKNQYKAYQGPWELLMKARHL